MRFCPSCLNRFNDEVMKCPLDGTALPPPTLVGAGEEGASTPAEAHFSDHRPPGTQLGSYRIERLIAEGGMGEVYEAIHTQLGRRVALKLMNQTTVAHPQSVERFFTEARVVNQIPHPHIVEITDIIDASDTDKYFIMELLEGETLFERISREGALPVDDCLTIAHQIAEALSSVHRAGVIHRDLKPNNIFLCARKDGIHVKLLDFGIVKSIEGDLGKRLEETDIDTVMGTPEFMSPEQFKKGNVDYRADVYAFGLVLFNMLTGRRLFQGANFAQLAVEHMTVAPRRPSEVRRGEGTISAALDALVLSCLAKDPELRRQSMDRILEFLAKIARGREVPMRIPLTEAPSPLAVPETREVRTLEKRGLPIWAAILMVALGAAGALILERLLF